MGFGFGLLGDIFSSVTPDSGPDVSEPIADQPELDLNGNSSRCLAIAERKLLDERELWFRPHWMTRNHSQFPPRVQEALVIANVNRVMGAVFTGGGFSRNAALNEFYAMLKPGSHEELNRIRVNALGGRIEES